MDYFFISGKQCCTGRAHMETGYGNTQEELAVSLGMNRVTVSKVLGEWKKKKIISTTYGHIYIENRDYLESLLLPSKL